MNEWMETKRTHLALQRAARRLLSPHGITPAQFELMDALGVEGMRQSDLSKQLNVSRSVTCEMVQSLEGVGWVKCVRSVDARTKLVTRTPSGHVVFERARGAISARRGVRTGGGARPSASRPSR